MKNKYRIILSLLCLSLLVSGTGSYMNSGAADEQVRIWKFAVISDTQGDNREQKNKSCINDEILKSIAADIADQRPDFVLVSGDLVNGWFRNGDTRFSTQYINWKDAMKPVLNMGIRIFAVRGNHDSGPERIVLPPLPPHLEPLPGSLGLLEKEFKKANIRSYTPMNGPEKEKGLTYSFIHKNAFIIGLDQYTDGEHRINQKWLDLQLSKNRETNIFVFGHEPAFEADHKDNLSFFREDRNRFWDSIGKAGGRIYFCGHDHFYNRAFIKDSNGNPVWQVIGGTGGGRLRKWSGSYKESDRVKCEYYNNDHHGYILVSVDGSKIKVEWRAIVEPAVDKWEILDTFIYSTASFK